MKLLISLVVFFILFRLYKANRIVSSSSVWVACYWLIFVIYPICGMEDPIANEGLIDLYAFIGILSFGIGLLLSSFARIDIYEIQNNIPRCPIFNRSLFGFIIVTLVAVGGFIRLYGASSVQDILLGSMTSKMIKSDLRGESAGIELIFLQIMMPCALSVWFTAKTKKQKYIRLICLFIFVFVQVVFNFTRIFLITFLAVILFYELRNKTTKVQSVLLGGGAVVLIVAMVIMNFVRTFGFMEQSGKERLTDISYIFESTDFGASYYWFDKLLDYGYPAISPIVWLKPIFAFIPRSIWPLKPEKLSLQILLKIDPMLADSGYTTAGNSVLGEGYAIAGIVGIIFFPFIWGWVCGYLDKKHSYRLKIGHQESINEIMYYLFTIFIVLCIQRGDWSQYMITFLYWWFLPLLIISKKRSVSIA